jgi:flagellar basal body rod protein FlgB
MEKNWMGCRIPNFCSKKYLKSLKIHFDSRTALEQHKANYFANKLRKIAEKMTTFLSTKTCKYLHLRATLTAFFSDFKPCKRLFSMKNDKNSIFIISSNSEMKLNSRRYRRIKVLLLKKSTAAHQNDSNQFDC